MGVGINVKIGLPGVLIWSLWWKEPGLGEEIYSLARIVAAESICTHR